MVRVKFIEYLTVVTCMNKIINHNCKEKNFFEYFSHNIVMENKNFTSIQICQNKEIFQS